jgi:pyruvate dehydrogenase kinase 2/3/4
MEDSRLGALRSMSLSTQGITATVKEQLNTMSQAATKETPDRIAPHPRIGIGLPMSNIFATFVFFCQNCYVRLLSLWLFSYFGGSLELVSMDGYGRSQMLYPRMV